MINILGAEVPREAFLMTVGILAGFLIKPFFRYIIKPTYFWICQVLMTAAFRDSGGIATFVQNVYHKTSNGGEKMTFSYFAIQTKEQFSAIEEHLGVSLRYDGKRRTDRIKALEEKVAALEAKSGG